jgi:hypothetical protein
MRLDLSTTGGDWVPLSVLTSGRTRCWEMERDVEKPKEKEKHEEMDEEREMQRGSEP